MPASKNKLTLVLLLILGFTLTKAQPGFEWAKQIHTLDANWSSQITHDAFGNVYTSGRFYGTVDFDPGPGTYNLTSNVLNLPDIFILKQDASGNFLWVKQLSSSSNSSSGLKSDDLGNIYIYGELRDIMDADPGPGIHNLYAAYGVNIFIIKLNSSGNFIWAKNTTGNYCFPTCLNLDSKGNIYCTGWLYGTTDFDMGTNTFNLNGTNNGSDYILKLDSNGNFLWVTKLGFQGAALGRLVAIDSKGNIYSSGTYGLKSDFDPGPGIYNLYLRGKNDIFISKLDSSGNFIWAKQMGGAGDDQVGSMVLDKNDNIYISGSFEGNANFDSGTGTTSLSSTDGNPDAFIAKLDFNGHLTWVKQFAGNFLNIYPFRNNLALDNLYGIYFSGSFLDTVTFDPGNSNIKLISNGIDDIFICEINSYGNFIWEKRIGGAGNEYYPGISSDSAYIYAKGSFDKTVDFDPTDAGIYNMTDTAYTGFFILKWNKCFSSSEIAITACDSFRLGNEVYKFSGLYQQKLVNYKGCDSIITLHLTILKKPEAKFTVQSQAGCQYVSYSFIDSSIADTVSKSGYSYQWDYGDGISSTVNSPFRIQNFKHIYNNSGTYTVRLIFSNGFCSDTFSILNKVTILPAPKPGFSVNAHHGCTPFILNLKDTLTTNITLKEYSFFGSGFMVLQNKSALDTFIPINTPGTYIIHQRVTGITGCVTQFIDTIIIGPGITKLDTVNVLYTTVIDSFTTHIQWKKLPHAAAYTIRNKTVIDTFFTDLNAQPSAQSEKYYLMAFDSCGNQSAVSPVAQTICLQGENQDFNAFALLHYTPYETWKQGVLHYEIEYKNYTTDAWTKLDSTAGNILSTKASVIPDKVNSNITASQTCYRIKAIEQNGNQQISLSNMVCVPVYPVVFLPNAFSPNGDGINEYYKPIAAGLDQYIFEIYDRWGQLIYTDTPESKGWDGTFRGEALPPGAFVYRLSCTSFLINPSINKTRMMERKGILYLVR